jgi:hypothetical protein
MFEVYFDDSGTDPHSTIAIAACYISTKRSWDEFVRAWDEARRDEGFECFHMVDFAAYHDKTKKPFCDWEIEKRQRVYKRLATIINENKRVGLGIAIPKDTYDRLVPNLPDWLRWRMGKFHYTFAVRILMGLIKDWRFRYNIRLPMQYIFDREAREEARAEIRATWEGIEKRQSWSIKYGIEKEDGYSFQNKCVYKPLQAADILAWQLNNHMRNVIMAGKDEMEHTHPNFKILRLDQEMNMGYFQDHQLQDFIDRSLAAGEPNNENETG